MQGVALFIDLDNISITLSEQDLKPDWDIIIEAIKNKYGEDARIVLGKAYFERKEGEQGSRYCYTLYERGIEPIYAPAYGFSDRRKSLSDPLMMCDIMETLYELDHIKNFVIASSDKDFIPVIKHLVKKNKSVLVIGLKENNKYLVNESSRLGIEFVDYIDIKSKLKK